MPKHRMSSEVAFHIKATRTGDIPLEIYDALYYSGRFEPIYRIQGDMVLSAYFTPGAGRESGFRRMGRRILKELTIDIENKPRGQEVRIENLMPVFEEEKSFYRDPKVRISCKSESDCNSSAIAGTIARQIGLLEDTENVLLQVHDMQRMADARISLTLRNGSYNLERLKEENLSLRDVKISCSATKRTWNLNFDRSLLQEVVMPGIMKVTSSMIDQR